MRKILAKRNLLLAGLSFGLVCLAACQEKPGTTVVPTTNPTFTPTTTPIPTESIAPSVEPTIEPTIEPTMEPTETVAPEPTIAPTTEPTSAPTETPLPTATPEPTCTPTPTEIPHVHEWIPFVTPPTCTSDGMQWEECLCGEKQNELVLFATGHGKTEKRTAKEPSVNEEGEWEEICLICEEVIDKGAIKSLTPTPTPIPSVTPKPTATPMPTATPTPTPIPTCSHGTVRTSLLEETDTERVYQDVCDDCEEVLGTHSELKATPTPSPIPATPTPKPTNIPTPTPDFGSVVENRVSYAGNPVTVYENGMEVHDITNDKTYDYKYKDNDYCDYTVIYGRDYYNKSLGGWLGQEWLVRCDQVPLNTSHKETLTYYMYHTLDYDNNGKGSQVRLVNSDGTFNCYSDFIYDDARFNINFDYVGAVVNNAFGVEFNGIVISNHSTGYVITPEELIADGRLNTKTREIKLFDY